MLPAGQNITELSRCCVIPHPHYSLGGDQTAMQGRGVPAMGCRRMRACSIMHSVPSDKKCAWGGTRSLQGCATKL